MPVFHARARHASTCSIGRSLKRLGTALRKLSERALASEDFETFEREVHALFGEAEREVLAGQLEGLDVDLPYVTIEGRTHHRVLRSSETYTSAVGPLTVTRTLYRARKGQAVVPLELRAGILEGYWTPLAARQAKRARASAAGKQTKGPSGYQEVGCATLSFYDGERERLETLRFARMPEKTKATLKSMLTAEVHAALAQRPDLTVVKIADGARDNWTYLNTLVPEGRALVDYFHAAEQLKGAFDAAYGENSSSAQAQFKKYRHILLEDEEGIEKVIRALVYLRSKHRLRKRIAEVLGYFRRNRHRMRYAQAKSCNLPVGSGVVEAACKTLATQRMKRSGMRWRHAGGQAILTLRALVQSQRFEQAWTLLSGTYRAVVTLPENMAEFPRERAA